MYKNIKLFKKDGYIGCWATSAEAYKICKVYRLGLHIWKDGEYFNLRIVYWRSKYRTYYAHLGVKYREKYTCAG